MLGRYEAQEALRDAAANFPKPLGVLGGFLMKVGMVGSNYAKPGDALTKEVSNNLTTPSKLRELYLKNVFVSGEDGDRVTDLLKALPIVCDADNLQASLRKSKRNPTDSEKELLKRAEDYRDALIQVNVFERMGKLETSNPNHVRYALDQTSKWPGANEPSFAKQAALKK
jgi:hypothetical protein